MGLSLRPLAMLAVLGAAVAAHTLHGLRESGQPPSAALQATADARARAAQLDAKTAGHATQSGLHGGTEQDVTAPARVAAARAQIGVTVHYDPAYVRLPYPGGDVPEDRGVCTDVVIRALRQEGLDLQQAVHEDMRAHFALYPRTWGLRAPDRNIDHRRVPNLQVWFERRGWSLQSPQSASSQRGADGRTDDHTDDHTDYRAGDLVTWMLPGNLPHIGIVSDRRSLDGTPLILHNIGRGTQEEDILFEYRVTGHYRPATVPDNGVHLR